MLLGGLETLIEVWVDSDGRRPCHRWLHLPNQRDATPDLQMTCNGEAAIGLLLRQYVLSLTEIGCMTLTVESSHHEPAAHSTSIFS